MRVTQFTREALAFRRQQRGLKARGYERIEGPWEIFRGGRYREVITDAVISTDGKYVWVKTVLPLKGEKKE